MTEISIPRTLTLAVNKMIKSNNRVDPAELKTVCNNAGVKVLDYVESRAAADKSWTDRLYKSLSKTQQNTADNLFAEMRGDWERKLMRAKVLKELKGTVVAIDDDDFVV
jgi:hypothetical protein